MPEKLTVYDKGGPAVIDPDTKKQTQPAVEAGELQMWEIDAHEAVRNDPTRYSLKPWKPLKLSAADQKKADAAAALAKENAAQAKIDAAAVADANKQADAVAAKTAAAKAGAKPTAKPAAEPAAAGQTDTDGT